MKVILKKWWDKSTKSFTIVNYKKSWKKNGNKPRILLHHNNGKLINGDTCFDISLIVGYTIFNYTNWDLQKKKRGKKNAR